MATKTIKMRMDDLQPTYRAKETIRFTIDGQEYEIDLSTVNAEHFRNRFDKYIKAGRKVNANLDGVSKVFKTVAVPSPSNTALIRRWAQDQGIYVNPRGRVPSDVETKYYEYQNHLAKVNA